MVLTPPKADVTDHESAEKTPAEYHSIQEAAKDVCSEFKGISLGNKTLRDSCENNVEDKMTNNIQCNTYKTPDTTHFFSNNTNTPDRAKIIAAFYNVKDSTDRPRLSLDQKMFQHGSQSKSSDRPRPKCRRNLFGSNETLYADADENEFPSAESLDVEFMSAVEEEADINISLPMANEISLAPLMCLPLVYKTYFHGRSLNASDSDGSNSDEEDYADGESSGENDSTSDESCNYNDDKLVSNGECMRRNATINIYFSPSHKLLLFNSNSVNISPRDIAHACNERNLFVDGDSDAEYDQPRLLPEHYFAPRRQPRLPFRQRAINASPPFMRRLSFDNEYSDENNNPEAISVTEGIISMSTQTSEMLLQTPTSVARSSIRPVRRRLFDTDSGVAVDGDIYELCQPSHQSNGDIYELCQPSHQSNGDIYELCQPSHQSNGDIYELCQPSHQSNGDIYELCQPSHQSNGDIYELCQPSHQSNGDIYELCQPSHQSNGDIYELCQPSHQSNGDIYELCQPSHQSDGDIFELCHQSDGDIFELFQPSHESDGDIFELCQPSHESDGDIFELCHQSDGDIFELFQPSHQSNGDIFELCQPSHESDGDIFELCHQSDGDIYELCQPSHQSDGDIFELYQPSHQSDGDIFELCQPSHQSDGDIYELCQPSHQSTDSSLDTSSGLSSHNDNIQKDESSGEVSHDVFPRETSQIISFNQCSCNESSVENTNNNFSSQCNQNEWSKEISHTDSVGETSCNSPSQNDDLARQSIHSEYSSSQSAYNADSSSQSAYNTDSSSQSAYNTDSSSQSSYNIDSFSHSIHSNDSSSQSTHNNNSSSQSTHDNHPSSLSAHKKDSCKKSSNNSCQISNDITTDITHLEKRMYN